MNIGIIGCGFAGLSSALFLARKNSNNKITIIDKFATIKSIGAGIMIQPSSMEVLKELGLYEDLLKYGEKIKNIIGLNQHKKQVFGTYYEDYIKNGFGIGIHRTVLFDLLYQACLKENNIQFILNREVKSIKEIGDINQYDVIIIANGSHSELRTQLPIKQSYKNYPYGCLWTTIEDENTTLNKLQQYMHYSKEMFGLLPSGYIGGKRKLSIFWSLPIKEKEIYSKDDVLLSMEKHHSDPVLLKKIKNSELSFATYADVHMNKYHYKNIVVIGDAAHGMSPQLGQGANMAFIDAHFLSHILDENNIEGSLKEYSKKRIPHLHFYAQASKLLTPLFQSNYNIYGKLRDLIFYFSQKIRISRYMSSQILSGKRTSWLSKKELKYEKMN